MDEMVLSAFAQKPSASVRASDSAASNQEVLCVQNIGPAERRKRLTMGVVTLFVGLAIGILLVVTGANRFSRVILFLPFAGGAVGFFQAREKT
jgi:hypothetical protein